MDNASNHHPIPDEILSEIEVIFNLMPSHELYYIKKDEVQFTAYIEEVNKLFIRVLDEYDKYVSEPVSFLKKLYNILFPLIFLLILFHEKFKKWLGLEFTILLFIIITIVLVYVNRRKLRNNYVRFE